MEAVTPALLLLLAACSTSCSDQLFDGKLIALFSLVVAVCALTVGLIRLEVRPETLRIYLDHEKHTDATRVGESDVK